VEHRHSQGKQLGTLLEAQLGSLLAATIYRLRKSFSIQIREVANAERTRWSPGLRTHEPIQFLQVRHRRALFRRKSDRTIPINQRAILSRSNCMILLARETTSRFNLNPPLEQTHSLCGARGSIRRAFYGGDNASHSGFGQNCHSYFSRTADSKATGSGANHIRRWRPCQLARHAAQGGAHGIAFRTGGPCSLSWNRRVRPHIWRASTPPHKTSHPTLEPKPPPTAAGAF